MSNPCEINWSHSRINSTPKRKTTWLWSRKLQPSRTPLKLRRGITMHYRLSWTKKWLLTMTWSIVMKNWSDKLTVCSQTMLNWDNLKSSHFLWSPTNSRRSCKRRETGTWMTRASKQMTLCGKTGSNHWGITSLTRGLIWVNRMLPLLR